MIVHASSGMAKSPPTGIAERFWRGRRRPAFVRHMPPERTFMRGDLAATRSGLTTPTIYKNKTEVVRTGAAHLGVPTKDYDEDRQTRRVYVATATYWTDHGTTRH